MVEHAGDHLPGAPLLISSDQRLDEVPLVWHHDGIVEPRGYGHTVERFERRQRGANVTGGKVEQSESI